MAEWQPIETAPKDQSQQERLLGFETRGEWFLLEGALADWIAAGCIG